MSEDNSYASNGQYVLEEVKLFAKDLNTDDELEWNLIPTMYEISLFESIIKGPMTGYIAIQDSFNINELLPLYGEERIELSFYTAGNEDNPIEYQGLVYKVSEKHRISEHTSGYKIMFCSESALLSKRRFTNRGYKDVSSNVVQQIFDGMLVDRSEKRLEVSETKGVQTYSFGALEPLEAISIVSRRASSTQDDVGYVFYENNREYRFVPLQELYQQDPVAEYTNTQAGVYKDVKQRAQEQFESYQSIEINEENSFLDRLMDGVHGSNHAFFDIVNKTFVNYHYKKNERFDDTKSLGSMPDKKPVGNGQDTQSIVYHSDQSELTLNEVQGYMKKKESETFKALVSVFGDSTLVAGDVIYLVVPNWNVDQENVKTMFQGKVLIDSIRHTLTKDQYTQTLGVRKDSYDEEEEET